MSDGVEVRVLGFEELISGLEELTSEIEQGTPRALERVAARQATTVRAKVPRYTGALAGSVVSGVEEDRAYLGMGEGLPYAGWIEFGGTRGRPYYPEGRFVYPTAKQAESQIVAAASEATKKEIEAMRWTTPKA